MSRIWPVELRSHVVPFLLLSMFCASEAHTQVGALDPCSRQFPIGSERGNAAYEGDIDQSFFTHTSPSGLPGPIPNHPRSLFSSLRRPRFQTACDERDRILSILKEMKLYQVPYNEEPGPEHFDCDDACSFSAARFMERYGFDAGQLLLRGRKQRTWGQWWNNNPGTAYSHATVYVTGDHCTYVVDPLIDPEKNGCIVATLPRVIRWNESNAMNLFGQVTRHQRLSELTQIAACGPEWIRQAPEEKNAFCSPDFRAVISEHTGISIEELQQYARRYVSAQGPDGFNLLTNGQWTLPQ